MIIEFVPKHPLANEDHLGWIPMNLMGTDPTKPLKERLHDSYLHGGGWFPFDGFAMEENGNLSYPGDPETRLLWEAKVGEETLRVYEHAWVAVVQPDGSFEVCRMD